jgi:peptidoglycan/LPS O-acetylase OafA/YrhL
MQSSNVVGGKVTDLQVLRGISIVMVLLYHLSLPQTLLGLSAAKPVMPFWLGVEIFFIISGYVVTLSLIKDGFNGPRFFLRRIFRLVPVMLLFLLLSCALHVYIRRTDWPVSVKELFTTPTRDFLWQETSILFGYITLTNRPTSYFNGAMWSLSVEDQFYAAISLLCLAAAVVSGRSQRVARWCLLLVAGTLYLGVSMCRVSILFGFEPDKVLPSMAMYAMIWRFDFLGLGVVLAFVAPKVREGLRTYFKDRSTFLTPFLLLIPLAIVSLCETPYQNQFTARALTGFGMPVAGLSFGLLVLLAGENMALPVTRGWLYRTLWYLGDRSYTIYLFHFAIFAVAWLVVFRFWPSLMSDGITFGVSQMVLVMALLIPLVEVVYRLVELPFIRLGKRLTHAAPRDNGAVVLAMPSGLGRQEHRGAA